MDKIRFISVVALVGMLGTASAAFAYPGQQVASSAKISIAQARTIATKAVPGKIKSEELEKEDNGLRYSFDIKTSSGVREVGVDAKTGKVIENAVETGKD